VNSRLGDVMSVIRQLKPESPMAVLTNGTLLWNSDVRDELMGADMVMPSLDAASARVFGNINRPAVDLDIQRYIGGLIDFSNEYRGIIKLEVFILPGYNDHMEELDELKKAIVRIAPDAVQLNTLDRPGTVSDLKPASAEELEKIIDYWDLPGVENIAAAPVRKEQHSYRKDAEEAIMGMISRRPCTLDDLSDTLGIHISEINKYLDVLESENKISSVRQKRGIFYVPA
jgi:wyosine [tRNA(Phe)-imidazoG37] synthetase (radical SAM superfamily)